MDTITTAARRRAVMATIADLIVAAATGRTLRVAVGCTHPDETAFADQLTQALHTRGRPGHCLTATPKPVTTDGYPRTHSDTDGPTVAVITSGTPNPDETDLCRINIQLYTPNRVAPPAAARRGADGQHRDSLGGLEPDIIVDYLDPGGAAIRHLGPALAAPPSSAGSQSDRRVRPA
jgi:hypothetical protein